PDPGPGGSPTPGTGGTPGPDGSSTPGPSDPGATTTPGPSRPGSLQEIERQLANLDAEIARLVDDAGEDWDAAEANRILQLLAERQRISSLRDALDGGGDPNDY
ncbi:MAG: hypothetical protein ACRDHF_05800, partial [Tepidiformaceae bacterium]